MKNKMEIDYRPENGIIRVERPFEEGNFMTVGYNNIVRIEETLDERSGLLTYTGMSKDNLILMMFVGGAVDVTFIND